MNCPSRTDEPPLTDHPTWNQNPPFLSGDLTTCQDLNGIANAREHRDGSGGAAVTDDERGGNGMQRDGWAVADRMPVEAEGRKGLAWGWGSFDGMEFFFPSSSFCYRWRTSRLLSSFPNFQISLPSKTREAVPSILDFCPTSCQKRQSCAQDVGLTAFASQ